MANFCTNCGAKLESHYKFCTICGAEVGGNASGSSSKLSSEDVENKRARKELKMVVGGRWSYNLDFYKALRLNGLDIADAEAIKRQVEREIDSGQIKTAGVEVRVNQLLVEYKIRKQKEELERKRNLELVDEILKSEIGNGELGRMFWTSVRDRLRSKIIEDGQDLSDAEIRHFIRREKNKVRREMEKAQAAKEREIARKKVEVQPTRGGYCNYSCIHCYEEFVGSEGIVADFTGAEVVDHYCNIGYCVAYGSFCEHYEE